MKAFIVNIHYQLPPKRAAADEAQTCVASVKVGLNIQTRLGRVRARRSTWTEDEDRQLNQVAGHITDAVLRELLYPLAATSESECKYEVSLPATRRRHTVQR